MFIHPGFDPVAIKLGPLAVHWYGLSYLAGFGLAWWIGLQRLKLPHVQAERWNREQVGDLVFYVVMGVIVGGRIGYVLFYNIGRLAEDPLYLVKIWEGGMSFHGGLVGVGFCLALFARKYQRAWFEVTDFMVILAPAGLLCGRLGNFINGELWGRPTDLPWGMVFPRVDDLARHPSQLYEAGLEGVLLLIIMLWFARKPRPRMAASGLFLCGYGAFRFSVEFLRNPDAHIGFLAWDWVTMGQILSAPMFVVGSLWLVWAYRQPEAQVVPAPKGRKKRRS